MGSRVPFAVFCTGIVLLILAYIQGDAGAGIFIIFPFIYGTGILAFAGVLLIILSFFLFVFSLPHAPGENRWYHSIEKEKVEKKTGGIIFIGPLPIIFSSDSGMAKILVFIALCMLLLMILVFFLLA